MIKLISPHHSCDNLYIYNTIQNYSRQSNLTSDDKQLITVLYNAQNITGLIEQSLIVCSITTTGIYILLLKSNTDFLLNVLRSFIFGMNEIRLNELQLEGILKTYLNFAFVRDIAGSF